MTRSSRGPLQKLGSVATYVVRNAQFLDLIIMREAAPLKTAAQRTPKYTPLTREAFSMISIFNRAQLPPLFDPARRDSLCQALDQAGIEYTVKTVDRSSPSALNFGSRERGGTLLHQMEQNWYYLVYVKKSDWEAAQRLL